MTIPPVIWMYWDQGANAQRAAYLDLCEQSIRRHAGDLHVRVLNAETARALVTDLPRQWEQLSPVHRSDVLRAHLLHEYGGVWIDADVVAVRPIRDLADAVVDCDFATFPDRDDAYIGVMLAARGSLVARAWAEGQRALLDDGVNPGWETLGSGALMPALRKFGGNMLPIEKVYPVEWRDWRLFMSPTYPLARVVAGNPVLVSFYNALMGPVLAEVTQEQIQRSRRLYARILRYAYSNRMPRTEALRSTAEPFFSGLRRARTSATYRFRRRLAETRART